jgi:hypothetical protein
VITDSLLVTLWITVLPVLSKYDSQLLFQFAKAPLDPSPFDGPHLPCARN